MKTALYILILGFGMTAGAGDIIEVNCNRFPRPLISHSVVDAPLELSGNSRLKVPFEFARVRKITCFDFGNGTYDTIVELFTSKDAPKDIKQDKCEIDYTYKLSSDLRIPILTHKQSECW